LVRAGKPSEIANYGTVVVVGGGVGAAMAYRTAAALKRARNRRLSIVGTGNKELAILEPEMRAVSDLLMITTDDGSCTDKGFIIDKLCQLMQNKTVIDLFVAAGPNRDDEGDRRDDPQGKHPPGRQSELLA
jgi:ferredoxin--NADP+ reductase